MLMPTKDEIKEKLELLLKKDISREEISNWAMSYIINDEIIQNFNDLLWDYLVDISFIGEMIAPNTYLYDDDKVLSLYNSFECI